MPAKPSASKPKGRASSTSTTLRFIRMLRLVPREPRKIAVRELVSRLAGAGFPVSRRSVERDLQALNAEGYLQHDDAAMGKGWFTPRNAVAMHVADMTPAEALALHLGGKHLAALLPPAVVDEITPFLNAAERVLKDNWRSERATWRNKVR